MLTRLRSTAPPRRITEESSRSALVVVEERRRPSVAARAGAGAVAGANPAFDDGIGGALPPSVSSSQEARGA